MMFIACVPRPNNGVSDTLTALLGVRGKAEHEAAMAQHKITPIDLVVVNLYPFEATVAKVRTTCTHTHTTRAHTHADSRTHTHAHDGRS